MNKMTHDEMLKYSAELVVKNNPDEATKLLIQLQKENEELKKCNRESITFLNQDDIRDILIRKDSKIFNLQQAIDKAIEYIKENACYITDGKNKEMCVDDINYDECMELLNILRDEDNE